MSKYYVRAAMMHDGKLIERLGTISAFTIDGRFGKQRAIEAAREAVGGLAHSWPFEYAGFFIKKANRFPDYNTQEDHYM